MKYLIVARRLGNREVYEVRCENAPDEFADQTGNIVMSYHEAVQCALARASYASLLIGESVQIEDQTFRITLDVVARKRDVTA